MLGKAMGYEGQSVSRLVARRELQQVKRDSRRVVCQVEEERRPVERTVLLEVRLEEPSGLHVDSHGSEDDREVVLVTVVNTFARSWSLDETGLSTDLSGDLKRGRGSNVGDLVRADTGTQHVHKTARPRQGTYVVVRKTRSREDGDLLTSSNRVHDVDRRDTSLDHLLGVDSRVGVDGHSWTTVESLVRSRTSDQGREVEDMGRRAKEREGRRLTVDVEVVLGKDLGSLVDGITRSVEDSTLHVLRNGQLHGRSRELDVGRLDVDTRRALEDLDDGLLALDLEDLTSSLGAVGQSKGDDLVIRGELRGGLKRRRHVSKEPV
jgi:hypothetical protein